MAAAAWQPVACTAVGVGTAATRCGPSNRGRIERGHGPSPHLAHELLQLGCADGLAALEECLDAVAHLSHGYE